MIYRTLVVVMASTFASANETFPLYDDIPKLLCYTSRVLQKCFSHCGDHLINMCPSKLCKFIKSPATCSANNEVSDVSSQPYSGTSERFKKSDWFAHAPSPTAIAVQQRMPLRKFAELRNTSAAQISSSISAKLMLLEAAQASPTSSRGSVFLSPGHSITAATDMDLLSACGTSLTHPPDSPCLSRKIVGKLLLSCCQQHISSYFRHRSVGRPYEHFTGERFDVSQQLECHHLLCAHYDQQTNNLNIFVNSICICNMFQEVERKREVLQSLHSHYQGMAN